LLHCTIPFHAVSSSYFICLRRQSRFDLECRTCIFVDTYKLFLLCSNSHFA